MKWTLINYFYWKKHILNTLVEIIFNNQILRNPIICAISLLLQYQHRPAHYFGCLSLFMYELFKTLHLLFSLSIAAVIIQILYYYSFGV